MVAIPAISFDACKDEAVLTLAESVRREIFARLVDLPDITVTADQIATDGASGLHVDLLCNRLTPDLVELSVALRSLESGEAVWGWTWTTPGTDEDCDRVAAEVADRVATAISSRDISSTISFIMSCLSEAGSASF